MCAEIILFKATLSVVNFAAINTSALKNFAQHSANDAITATKRIIFQKLVPSLETVLNKQKTKAISCHLTIPSIA